MCNHIELNSVRNGAHFLCKLPTFGAQQCQYFLLT
ncbi:Uncharacterised protein [Vibrio cholerae]|nr:Uncharacterised protein [Vibrio cholerae]